MEQWQNKYSGIDASVIENVLQTFGEDEAQIDNILQQMHVEREQELLRDKERKIQQVPTFVECLGREVVSRVLEENNWDVDSALIPLFECVQKKQEDERRKRTEEEKKRREEERNKQKEENLKKAQQYLHNVYNLAVEDIQKILVATDGDIEQATQVLKKKAEEIENQKLQQEERKEQQRLEEERKLLQQRRNMERALQDKLDNVSPEEIHKCFEKNHWNMQVSAQELKALSEERMKKEIMAFFRSISPEEVQAVLEQSNWNERVARQRLLQLKKEKSQPNKSPLPQKPTSEELKIAQEKKIQSSLVFAKEAITTFETITKRENEEQSRQLDQLLQSGIEEKITQQTRNLKAPSLIFTPEKNEEAGMRSQPSPADPKVNAPPEDLIKHKAEITLSSNSIDLGASVEVQWTIERISLSTDFIALCSASNPNPKNWLTYQYVNPNTQTGKCTFSLSEYGKYNFRFVDSSWSTLGISETLHVGPRVELDITTDTSGPKHKFQVRYKQLSKGSLSSAWIGLYNQREKNNSNYLESHWISEAENQVLYFDIPKSGVWSFRFFPDRRLLYSYVPVEETQICVSGKDELKIALHSDPNELQVNYLIETVDPLRDSVWIGLFFVGDHDSTRPRRWKSLTVGGRAETTIKRPRTPGLYELRLLSNLSPLPICTSNQIELKATE